MKKAMAMILTGREKAWGTEMLVPVGTGKAYLERGEVSCGGNLRFPGYERFHRIDTHLRKKIPV